MSGWPRRWVRPVEGGAKRQPGQVFSSRSSSQKLPWIEVVVLPTRSFPIYLLL
jgi:hypothetical protein